MRRDFKRVGKECDGGFQLTRLREARRFLSGGNSPAYQFQLTRLREARRMIDDTESFMLLFQLTRLREARLALSRRRSIFQVSTNAPA